MARIHIKNCGLKRPGDVEAAIGSGATHLGFVFHAPSPRHIDVSDAASLCRALPAHIASAAVMVNPADDALQTLLAQWRPTYLQLHGDESPQRVQVIREQSGLPIIKAIGIAQADDVKSAHDFFAVCDMMLFDTKHLDLPGGSGIRFDWGLLAGLSLPLPWFLSGGLDAGNVEEALRTTRAPGVDVSSGIEQSRGVKDTQKIIAFNETVCRISL